MFAFTQPSLELYTKSLTKLPEKDSFALAYADQGRMREASYLPPWE